jgi:hypothetical protein
MKYRITCTDAQGRQQHAWGFATKAEAQHAAKEYRGRHPWGNRVKVEPCKEPLP